MEKKIKELIVVEGKTDIDFLSSFLEADFYSVNGSAINEEDLKFLEQANNERGILILTDPDFPGQQIRNIINARIKGAKNSFVAKEVSIKNHKVGVAESTKEEVLKAIKNSITYKEDKNVFSKTDLYNLKLSGHECSQESRNKLTNKLNIGYSNSKQLLVKLNSIGISYKEVEEILNAN